VSSTPSFSSILDISSTMICVTIQKEQTIPQFVEKAIEVSKTNGIITHTTIDFSMLSDLQDELAKVNLQMRKIDHMDIHIGALHEYCNCIRMNFYDKYICKYHEGLRALGPQYWIQGDKIKFDNDHAYIIEHGIFPLKGQCYLTTPKFAETLAYLTSKYGPPGNENAEQLQHQYKLRD
jgi:hypothetical protein